MHIFSQKKVYLSPVELLKVGCNGKHDRLTSIFCFEDRRIETFVLSGRANEGKRLLSRLLSGESFRAPRVGSSETRAAPPRAWVFLQYLLTRPAGLAMTRGKTWAFFLL